MGGLKVFRLSFVVLSIIYLAYAVDESNHHSVTDNDITDDDFCDADSCGPGNEGANEHPTGSDDVVSSPDELQDEKENSVDKLTGNEISSEEINVMITFYNAVHKTKLINTFTTTVQSLLKHATVPIAIHIIGDPESQNLAADIIAKNSHDNKNYKVVTLDVDKLAVELEDIITPMQQHFSYKPGAYYNHALFFLSIAMHKVMPHLNKVIMLDADLKFMDDIKKLHDRFRLFTKENIIGIGRDLQPVYRHTFWKYRQEHPGTRVGNPPPDGLTGFNSGVLLLDLEKMRQSSLYSVLLSSEKLEALTSEFHFKGHLGDQDFFTLLSMKYEWLFHVLPCQWNRQLCTWWKNHGYENIFDQYFTCEGDIKIYHGNCGTPIPDVD